MKTKLTCLAAGILVAAVNAGFGQPVITQHPQSCSNFIGTTASFTVTATGTAPLAYQWQTKDYFGNVADLAGCTDTNLVLTNVQPSHGGNYLVVVTNVDGAVTSAVARLTIIPPPVITNPPQPQAVASGTTATFMVGVSGTGPLVYQWQRNVGAGFSDLANRTNAVLTLTNAQTWDAWDYRVIVANPSGARTSVVAHLYVMPPALLTNRVVVDNFDVNSLAQWTWGGNGTQFPLLETNHQLTVRGQWTGMFTHAHFDTWVWPNLGANWSVANNKQTLEGRLDLVRMSVNATNAAGFALWSDSAGGSYTLLKGRDFVQLGKWVGSGVAVLFHEQAVIKNTNVVLCLALTRLDPNLVVTARVLDKDNQEAVLYQRSVLDTPQADRTVTSAELLALSGMGLNVYTDNGPPITSGNAILLSAWQYTDGKQPRLDIIYDNLELRTYTVPTTRYVDATSTNATPPYTNWATATPIIQDAVDAAAPGDEIVVTNGTYATGGRAVGTNLLLNRVAVDKPLMLRSVNGPQFTVIQGYQVPGTTNGDGAIRCVYLTNGASLSGFTLTNGATGTNWDYGLDLSGGGVWCKSTNAVVSNCVVADNSASDAGGGAYGATLSGCILNANSAHWGGGAARGTLNNCTLTGNAAGLGGGAYFGTLNNCILVENWAQDRGGGVYAGTLNNCTLVGNSAQDGGGAGGLCGHGICDVPTLNNCIVYFNTAASEGNWSEASSLNDCCTIPLPTIGVGNITNAPLFVDYAGGNLRLQSNSPCINAGKNAYAPGLTDLDGNPRIVRGTVDIGAYEFQGPGSAISYAWLQHYGLPTDGTEDFADPDRDGLNTWREWRCQTDPTNSLSVLRLLSASRTGTNVTVTWQSVAGVSYFLERSTNVAGPPPIFAPLATGIPGQPGTTTSFTDTNAAATPRLFYRVGVGN